MGSGHRYHAPRCCRDVNPYPTPIPLGGIEISVTVPSAPRRPGDRSRAILGRVWIGTMDPHSQGPTARSRARSLGLGVAPASTIVNPFPDPGPSRRSRPSRRSNPGPAEAAPRGPCYRFLAPRDGLSVFYSGQPKNGICRIFPSRSWAAACKALHRAPQHATLSR